MLQSSDNVLEFSRILKPKNAGRQASEILKEDLEMKKCNAEKRYENKLAKLMGNPLPYPDLEDKGKKELEKVAEIIRNGSRTLEV